jgi:hypothetical protein
MCVNASDWHSIITTSAGLAVSILGGLVGITAAVNFFWSNLRIPAKRLAILDLATKRIAFWDQFLKVELAAAESDQEKLKQARERAHCAIETVRADGVRQLERLCWKAKRDQCIREQFGWKRILTFRPHCSLDLSDTVSWWGYICLAWMGLIVYVWLSVGLFSQTGHDVLLRERTQWFTTADKSLFQRIGVMLFFAGFTGWARFQAERLKYKAPPEPVIDTL